MATILVKKIHHKDTEDTKKTECETGDNDRSLLAFTVFFVSLW
jgi:hypothetical protein